MKIWYLSLLLFCMPMWLSAQDVVTLDNAPKKVLKLYKKAEKCIAENQVERAIQKLEKALSSEPRFIDAHLKLGGLHYDRKNYSEAINAFKMASALGPNNPKITQALAVSYEKAEDYEKAIENYQLYLEQSPKLKEEQSANIESKILTFQFRKSAINNPIDFSPQVLPPTVNHPKLSEYSPSLTADGQRLFFTRVSANQEDIYYSEKDSSGQWSEAILLPNLNTMENEGAHTIAADGKTILFTYCSDRANPPYRGCNIYAAFKRNGTWTKPAFFEAINSKSWDTQPNISADGQRVIFVSKRAGGQGASDLWWSERNNEGKWTVPENLGPVINTSLREESPFFHPDGKTLFFKSEGHPGMGSFDLFMSELGPNGEWSKPVNLGYPINTEDHEGALVVSLDGKTAYYSKGDGKVSFDAKKSDLYTFELPEGRRADPVGFAQIKVLDSQENIPLEARIEIRSDDGITRLLRTDQEGEVIVILPVGRNFSLNIDKENYYFHSERFELDSSNTAETAFDLEVYLNKIEPKVTSEPIILKNVLFNTGSFELQEESYFELNNLVSLLNDNSEVSIEIRGHTDDVGDESDNQILSENRARAVYDYLISMGIDQNRLSYVGLGESQPISTNTTEEGRKINRRTEFISKQ